MGYKVWLLRGISLPLVTWLEKGIMGYKVWLLRGISLPLVTWLERGIMGYKVWLLRGISLPLVTWSWTQGKRFNIFTQFIPLGILSTDAVLKIKDGAPPVVTLGLDVILPCTFSLDQPVNLQYLAILWTFQNKEFFRLDNKGKQPNPRVTFIDADAKKGIASLLLHNVTVSDAGVYTCKIIYSPDIESKDIMLKVQSLPTVEVLERLTDEQSMIVCSASRFYPKNITVTIIQEGKDVTSSVLSNYQQNFDGTFSLNRSLTLEDSVKRRAMSCRVQHQSLAEPIEKAFLLLHGVKDESNNAVVFGAVGGCAVLLVLVIIGIVYCKYSSKKAKPKFIEPISMSLCDSGNQFYPKSMKISWGAGVPPSYNKMESDEEVTDSGIMYDLLSKCRITGRLLRDPDFTVKASWKHEFMSDWESTQLSIRDPGFPWKPVVQNIPVPNLFVNNPVTLMCQVSNIFPESMTLKWFRREKDGQDLFPVSHSEKYKIPEIKLEKQEDKTFQCRACLTFTPTISSEQGAEFICRVEHPSLEKTEERRTGPLQIQEEKTFISVEEKKFIVNDIQGPDKWTKGREVTLYAMASYCPKDIKVIWIIRERDGKVWEICDTPTEKGKKPTDKGLNRYVATRESTDTSDKEGLLNVSSSIRFIPSVSVHSGVSLMCRFVCDGKSEEREFKPKAIYAKPKLLEPIMLEWCNSEKVKYSLNLGGFYPKDMEITWTSGVGESQKKKKSSDQVQENPKWTFNIQSDCTINQKFFKDPKFKVCVSWKHESMENPQSREFSLQDLGHIWRPIMEEIPLHQILVGRQVSLQYKISGYFPDALTVSWYKKEKGKEELIPISGEGKYQIPDSNSKEQADKTLTYTASLVFSPSLSEEHGSEFICRVEHPILQKPIEKSTGPLFVWGAEAQSVVKPQPETDGKRQPVAIPQQETDGKPWPVVIPQPKTDGKPKLEKTREKAQPLMPQPVNITLCCDSGEVLFSLKLLSFYPKEIQTEWHLKTGPAKAKLSSTPSLTQNSDETWNIESNCKVSGNKLRDPKSRVSVTWKHETMEGPETREISALDPGFPWAPEIGEIVTPSLVPGEEATFQCKISRCLPAALTVTWYRKEEGDQEGFPVSHGDKYKIPKLREDYRHFSCTATLSFTPSPLTDNGVEFICMVEHPTLQHRIWRGTGPLQV
ncbi:hypothetical protein XELAEV_18002220mg [Xenopus laevis]|nr:hypothetical protein XELAEV_18002220mg [Xenopus laevis]